MYGDDDFMERAWEDYHRQLNNRWWCKLARRVAFSRWRRAVLWVAQWKLPRDWNERLGDALYPDDCLITFAPAGASR